MPKYSKQKVSEQTQAEAMTIAKGIQKPGQTKEQTKLVAQGIQKGIDLYKKQQKAKARELDKRLKKAAQQPTGDTVQQETETVGRVRQRWLPWVLLLVSWLGFAAFLFFWQ